MPDVRALNQILAVVVADYTRRYQVLYRLRCALRPTHSVDTATGALVEKPPLVDLRHRRRDSTGTA